MENQLSEIELIKEHRIAISAAETAEENNDRSTILNTYTTFLPNSQNYFNTMENQSSEIEPMTEHQNPAPTTEITEENNNSSTSSANITPSLNSQNSSTMESDNYKNNRLRLYRAAIKGDWESAAEVLRNWPDLRRVGITARGETVLHVAALARKGEFVKELLEIMDSRDLEIPNSNGSTALCYAALDETDLIAKDMLTKHPTLATVCGTDGSKALYMAALAGERKMVNNLYQLSQLVSWSTEHLAGLFTTCIGSGLLDVALRLIEDHPRVALAIDAAGDTALHVLARMPSEFAVATHQRKWRRFINSFLGMKEARDQNGMQTPAQELLKRILDNILGNVNLAISDMIEKTAEPLFIAAHLGNTEFLVEVIDTFPDLRWTMDSKRHTVYHIAVLKRHAKIFNLLRNTGSFKKMIASYRDDKENNMLHLAAILAPPTNISGAFFQMQHEMLWFKEVEKTVHPLYRKMWNSDGQTPIDAFTENHRDLKRKGEEWIKGIAQSSTAVATLVATVAFTAVFTMPGVVGGKDENCQKNKFFRFLPISEGVALSFSSISILIFLSIHTSHYVENNFLVSLPLKLLCGMTTLCISLAAMTLLFWITMLLCYRHGFVWIKVVFVLLSFVPTVYVLLKYPLLADIIRSIYSSRFLFSSK